MDFTNLDRQPCGCPDCDDRIQPGHFACSQPREAMLDAERYGYIARAYDDGAWRWFLTRKGEAAMERSLQVAADLERGKALLRAQGLPI